MAKKKTNERLRMIIMIVLAVIMALIATACVLYRTWVVKPELPPVGNATPEPTHSSETIESQTPDLPDYDPVQPKVSGERKSEDCYTILVFGTDVASGLTDTMMVVSYDVTNQQATVMSIPRDTLINVKRSYKKLNGIYSWYGGGGDGITALKNEVSELIGFTPDYYVQVDWELVGQMVDAIGGVYFEVPWDMWYRDPYQDLYIDLKEGYQLLDGDQAMQLVRWRKNMDPVTFETRDEVSDIKRLEIQHSFLKAVLKQTLQLKNVTRISELAKVFGENVVSDLSIENLFWFGSQAIMGGLSVDSVQFCTMPFAYGTDYKGNSYVYPVQNQLLTLINDGLNPFVQRVTLNQLDLMWVNADGTLGSSTGVLADPDMAVLPPEESEEPDPDTSDDPNASDDPEDPFGSDDPDGSGDPDATDDPNLWFDPEESEEPYTSDEPVYSDEPGDDPYPEYSEDPDDGEDDPIPTESNSGEMPG